MAAPINYLRDKRKRTSIEFANQFDRPDAEPGTTPLAQAYDKPTLAGKVLEALGIDASGERAKTSWPDAALSTMWTPYRMAEGAVNAFTAPARAYNGELGDYQDNREQFIGEGLNVAGNMALGGSAVPKPTQAAASAPKARAYTGSLSNRAPWASNDPSVALYSNGKASSLPGTMIRERSLDPLGYYSGALEAAKALPQAKGTPEQMLAMLKKGGAKEGELEATGLLGLLSNRPSITRDEIINHLEGNRVGLKEVQRSNEGNATGILDFFSGRSNNVGAPPPKWSAYSLDPYNPTYRETVLHLPEKGESWKKLDEELSPRIEQLYRQGREREANELELRIENAARYADGNNFRSGHFPEPNIVGHMMTSMTKHEGRPVYTIDQIQSDWGQKLREDVRKSDDKIAALRGQIDAAFPDLSEANRRNGHQLGNADHVRAERAALPPERLSELNRLRAELQQIETAPASGHPLVNTTDQWTNTTLRRAIQQANEAGADHIAIPSGKTVLGYNAGDEHGMNTFYDKIVPKNLGNILSKLDPSIKGQYVDQLETPGNGMAGSGFTVFPLTQAAKDAAKGGLPLFANGKSAGTAGAVAKEASDPIRAYHWTDQKFDKFDPKYTDEVGFHFGTRGQAMYRSAVKDQESGSLRSELFPLPWPIKGRMIPVDIEAKKILDMPDQGHWTARRVAGELQSRGMLPNDVARRVLSAPEKEGAEIIRNYLSDIGYDTVRYKNDYEGSGYSYMPLGVGNVKDARTGNVLWSNGKPSSLPGTLISEAGDERRKPKNAFMR